MGGRNGHSRFGDLRGDGAVSGVLVGRPLPYHSLRCGRGENQTLQAGGSPQEGGRGAQGGHHRGSCEETPVTDRKGLALRDSRLTQATPLNQRAVPLSHAFSGSDSNHKAPLPINLPGPRPLALDPTHAPTRATPPGASIKARVRCRTIHRQPGVRSSSSAPRRAGLCSALVIASVLRPHRRETQHGAEGKHLGQGRGVRVGVCEGARSNASHHDRTQRGLHLCASSAGPGYPRERVPPPGTAEGGVFPHIHGHGHRPCLQNRPN